MVCYDDILLAYAEMKSDIKMVRATSKRLSATDGIVLHVEEIDSSNGLMANQVHGEWWSRPHFSHHVESLSASNLCLLWKDAESYHNLLPVCGDIFKTDICGCEKGFAIKTSAYVDGYSNFSTLSFILGSNGNPFDLIKSTVSAGLKKLESAGKPRELRRYPDMLEYLGWCSWDAFYYDINEKGIFQKAEEFKQKGLPVKWFIIDAGWSDDNDTQLKSFQPHPEKFPNGLLPVIQRLKQEYGLDWIGVWHTIIGYWKGIDKESTLAKEMKEYLLTTNCGTVIPYPDASKSFMFFNKWHSWLRQQGVDFVKVDYQSILIKLLEGRMAIGKASREMHQGLEASVGINFDYRIINCMGMGLESIWHRPISGVSRNSDDFYPKVKDHFKEHALQNAYNSFFHGTFYWCDWDMWWTQHVESLHHAVLRAVSGGPVYVSDPLNTTDPEKVWPLILSDGRILRCEQPGLPTEDCLLKNPNTEAVPLKVWNRYGSCGFIAAFNIHLNGCRVEGKLSPSDIPHLREKTYAVYDHFEKELVTLNKEESIPLILDDSDVKLFMLAPVRNGFASLGLINKYISAAAVESEHVFEKEAVIILKEGGVYGFCSQKPIENILVNGMKKEYSLKGELYTVDCSEYEGMKVCIEIQF